MESNANGFAYKTENNKWKNILFQFIQCPICVVVPSISLKCVSRKQRQNNIKIEVDYLIVFFSFSSLFSLYPISLVLNILVARTSFQKFTQQKMHQKKNKNRARAFK